MKKFLIALGFLPFAAGIGAAGEPLSNHQMDQVTAGFSSVSMADAEGLGAIAITEHGDSVRGHSRYR